MFPLRCSLVVLCALSWTVGYATICSDLEIWIGERCCDKCPPGEYVKEYCTEQKQTLCSPCEQGFFSDQYTFFDRCEECQLCPDEYAEKCTPTTDAKCSCPPGFLCSDHVCSACEENKYVTEEKLNTTGITTDGKLIKNSECPGNAYFDAKEKICKPWTQCSTFKLAELFQGNKTHDSVCDVPATYRNGEESIYVMLGIGFILLLVSFLVFMSPACIEYLRKHKANNKPVLAVSTNTDFHLSKEESGLQLIIQDECTDCKSFTELYV